MLNTVHQSNLFGSTGERLDLPDADIYYWPSFAAQGIAEQWFETLRDEIPWEQHRVTVFGKTHPAPRLSYWVGDEWMSYSYSHQRMTPEPWTPLLNQIKQRIEDHCRQDVNDEVKFNSVLLNFYRDGQDSNGWHSDDEPELGVNPVIASLSLGASRDFHLRHKATKQTHKMSLEPGSLLLMQGTTQSCWQHHIPKRAWAEPRINLTFRWIVRGSWDPDFRQDDFIIYRNESVLFIGMNRSVQTIKIDDSIGFCAKLK